MSGLPDNINPAKAEGGENMQSAMERRQLVLEAISDRRQVKINELAAEHGVNERTIRRDIEVLSCSYPIVTAQGGAGASAPWTDGTSPAGI